MNVQDQGINREVVDASEKYVKRVFEEAFSEAYTFHNFKHILSVRDAVVKIADACGVDERARYALELAALFHDIGYAEDYENHEEISALMAGSFLTDYGLPDSDIQLVQRLIRATYPPRQPKDQLEMIIRDADLAHLGGDNYLESLERLRDEWRAIADLEYKSAGWYEMNVNFLLNHRFHTDEARKLYSGKSRNLDIIRSVKEALCKEKDEKQARKAKKKAGKKKKKGKKKSNNPMSSRPAQMMFKTSLRNHIDLTNIADNKANIMLSINAIIVTIMIPLVANNLRANPQLLVPVIFLLTTCIVSIIFAALVTRPIRMTGLTNVESIKEGKSNLFFFGNFYKLSLREYEDGMQQVLNNEEHLNNAIMRDLYFLGRSLGTKYKRLRICYLVFIIGMTATVLSFAISQIIF